MSEAVATDILSLNAAIEEAKRRGFAASSTVSSIDDLAPIQGPVESPVGGPLPNLKHIRGEREFREALQRPYDPDAFVEEQIRLSRENTLRDMNATLRSRGIDEVIPSQMSSSLDRPPASNTPDPRPLPRSNPPLRSTGPDRTPITRTPRTMGHNTPLRATDAPRTGMPSGFAEPLTQTLELRRCIMEG